MNLASPAFADGCAIPIRHTGCAEDLSPSLIFSEIPKEARELALTCRDPDADGWTHWLIYGLLAQSAGLRVGLARRQFVGEARQGLNSWGALGWGGPFPPAGPAHRYVFRLYAVKSALSLEPGVVYDVLMRRVSGRVLAQAELIGTFRRG